MTTPKGLEGTVIAGRYEVVALLGAGNFASVWRARHLPAGEDVAVKVLSPGYGSDPELVDDFIAQAKAFLAFRDEPNVARVLEAGHDLDTGLNFAALALQGPTVDALLAGSGPFPPERVLRVATDVGTALRAIHHKGLVHGDVKGTNVLAAPQGERFVLADFLVGLPESADGTAPTLDMSRIANWAYASPEKVQATSRRDLRPASDLYSLGVLLFHLATGRFPFESRFPQIVHDHLSTPAPDPRVHRPDLAAPLAELILRCLAKDPAARFLDADDFLRAVESARAVRPAAAVLSSRPRWFFGAVAGAIAVLAFVAFLFWPRGLELALRTVPERAQYRLYAGEMESRFDAIEVGETPADIAIEDEGTYTVVAEAEGYFPKTAVVEVKKGMAPAVLVLEEALELRVESDPPGADATLRALSGEREKYRGDETPTDFDELRAGPHEITLRLEGYAPFVDTLEVGAEATSFRAVLVPGTPVPLVLLTSPPGAEVSVDGDPSGEPTPCRLVDLLPGTYEIAFRHPEHARRDTSFVLSGGSAGDTLFVDLHARSSGDDRARPLGAADEPERAESRAVTLREDVRGHVARRAWREAERSLTALLEIVPADDETRAWRGRISAGLEEARSERSAGDPAARSGVQAALQKYEAALEARDLEAFARLWVSLQPSERSKYERALADIRSQSIEIGVPSIRIDGSRATVEFQEIRRIQPREGKEIAADRKRAMTLRRMGSGEWLIESMR